jgi:hypothetical protein
MPHPPLKTPILFILFNRPDTTQIVFNAIRDIRPLRLYVAADGPRPTVQSDLKRCADAREIIKGVDWNCEVKTLFREKNLGCGLGVSTAITWFFEQEPEGIVLEDDCLPSDSFFWFCQELLEKYRDDNRVMHIGGNNFLDDSPGNKDSSYYFSRNGHIWGWATWQRAWQAYDFKISLYEQLKEKGFFDEFFLNRLEKFYRMRKFNQVRDGSLDTWDYQWDFARFANSGLSIAPQRNLVKNIGFGADATHTTSANSKNSDLQAFDLDFPLKHPPFMLRDIERDRKYFSRFVKDTILSKLKR